MCRCILCFDELKETVYSYQGINTEEIIKVCEKCNDILAEQWQTGQGYYRPIIDATKGE